MAYANFTLSEVTRKFNIEPVESADLFKDAADATLRPEFLAQLNVTLPLALATSTKKARSEFIIAPILVELWLMLEQR